MLENCFDFILNATIAAKQDKNMYTNEATITFVKINDSDGDLMLCDHKFSISYDRFVTHSPFCVCVCVCYFLSNFSHTQQFLSIDQNEISERNLYLFTYMLCENH